MTQIPIDRDILKTLGILPLKLENSLLVRTVETIEDLLKYLSLDIHIVEGYGFLSREDISFDVDISKNIQMQQYWNNGLLISGMLENTTDNDFTKIQIKFDEILKLTKKIIEQKLRAFSINSTHQVIIDIDEEYSDIVISFWKKTDDNID